MKIDLTRLKMHSWFEDEEGNIYESTPGVGLPGKDHFTYHVVDPCVYSEEIDSYECHPEYRHENNSFYQAMLQFKWFRNWMKKRHRKEKTFKRMISFNTGFRSSWSQKCIVAMVNSGDFTLEEAIYVYCNSCERCMNVLLHKYLGDGDGYEENSEEWKKCNTECDWCRGE